MPEPRKKVTLRPPPGRPNWLANEDSPLLYLGWGQRDFKRHPLARHRDFGTNYYVILHGHIDLACAAGRHTVHGPSMLVMDSACAFAISQKQPSEVEILVWIWRDPPQLPEICPPPASYLQIALRPRDCEALVALHARCRDEVALADGYVTNTLGALRSLVESTMARALHPERTAQAGLWPQAQAWMANNLAIHAPVPALCDFLCLSPRSLHRFFAHHAGTSPGTYFRRLKLTEARRLIANGWQVKAAAYHLGYQHPNDLTRALASDAKKGIPDAGELSEG